LFGVFVWSGIGCTGQWGFLGGFYERVIEAVFEVWGVLGEYWGMKTDGDRRVVGRRGGEGEGEGEVGKWGELRGWLRIASGWRIVVGRENWMLLVVVVVVVVVDKDWEHSST
jgi:hypothetical protein